MLVFKWPLRAVCMFVYFSVCKRERKIDRESMHVNVFNGFYSSPYRLMVIWVRAKETRCRSLNTGSISPPSYQGL